MSRYPSAGAVANRRMLIYIMMAVFMLSIVGYFFRDSNPSISSIRQSIPNPLLRGSGTTTTQVQTQNRPPVEVGQDTIKGDAMMPKLGNATAKAELGRSAWHLFHTIMSRYPETPTQDQQTALSSYIHLFARVYPCGECAQHFQQLLDQYPPQVSSRNVAAGWGCFVHNEVNKSLGKPEFDCAKIGDWYDCGCGDEKNGTTTATATG